MADIFISYAREDREWVEKLANAFVAEGFSVWWDFDLLVGKRYRETIETELQTAKAAVVVWSQHSIRSDFVRDEAEDAQQRNILAPILKEIVRPPAGFRQLQTADLNNWTGNAEHVEFRRMMKGVSHLVGRPALGDTGAIHVDPAHPTTHFEEPKPVVPTPPVEVTPIDPVTPQPEPPPAVVAKAPAPVVMPAPAPVAPTPISPPPPHAAAPTAFVTTPKTSNPIVMYVAIGVVVLVAVAYGASQLFGGKTPAKPAQVANPVATPAVTHPTPGSTVPPATGGDATGGDTGGDVGGSDTGQSGPHGNSTPPPAPVPTPPTDNGTQDGSTSGDTGSDVGQGNPH
jgi:hypothetical protein